jgi:hypothetical protein
MKYFEECKTIDEVKEKYRKLAKKNHPDLGGNEEVMKQINKEYDMKISKLKDSKSEKRASSQVDESVIFKDIVNELIKYMDIEIEICGWFIWLSGNTKPIKEILKKLGFRWANKKKMWYYKPSWYYSGNRKEWSIKDIRNKYGSIKVDFKRNKKYKIEE